MDVALTLLLILAAIITSWYDTYSVQRTYANLCARRHGHIPPLMDWFFVPDADAEVERLRRRHRNMYLLAAAFAVAAVVVALVRSPTWH
jgi:hypothetical protein